MSAAGITVDTAPAPADTVSSLVFDLTGSRMLAASWDGSVHAYSTLGGRLDPLRAYRPAGEARESLLDVAFHEDGSSFYAVGCTGHVWKCNLEVPDAVDSIGKHSMPAKACFYNRSNGCVITAGWDQMLYMWDERSPSPAFSMELPHKVQAMDLKGGRLVIANPGPNVLLLDVSRATPAYHSSVPVRGSGLERGHSIRCVSMFTDLTGCVIGYAEGRCSVVYFDDQTRSFNFKCHRIGHKRVIHAVNTIAFSRWNSFATAGSDGGYSFWDQDQKRRIKSFQPLPMPVTACAFAHVQESNQDLFVFATGNDWSQGSDPSMAKPPQLHYLYPNESDVKLPPKTHTPRRR